MGNYIGDREYDFAIIAFDGPDTADEAFEVLKGLEEREKLTIDEAAVITRTEKGKIRLNNKGYVAGWKGGAIGLGVGLLLGGPVGGAVVGGLIGFARGNDRRNLRGVVNERLGMNQSALAFVASDADWAAIKAAMDTFEGDTVYAGLQGESLVRLEQLAEDEEITGAAEEAFEEVTTD